MNHKSLMWTDGLVMSECTQDSQNVCTILLSLPDNAIFSPSAKILRLHPQSDHIINTHANQVKTLHMDLSCDHFNSSLLAKTHI